MVAAIADVRDFGTGMGVGSVSDDNAGFANMFATLKMGDSVYIPLTEKGFIVDEDFARSSSITMIGAGCHGSNSDWEGGARITYRGDGTFLTLDGGGSGYGSLLENFRVVADSADFVRLIHIKGTGAHVTLRHLMLEPGDDYIGDGTGVELEEAFSLDLIDNCIRRFDKGIHANILGASFHVVNNLNILDNKLAENTTAIDWQGGAGGTIAGNDFSGVGLAMDFGRDLPNAGFLESVEVGYNWIEGGTYARLGYNAHANTNVRNISFCGGELHCSDDYIKLVRCENVSVIGSPHFAALSAGKKHLRISANAKDTSVNIPKIAPADIEDLSTTTVYAPHLLGSLNVYRSTNQTVAYNTQVNVQFDTVSYDKYGEWDATAKGWRCKRKSATGFLFYGCAQFVNMNVGESVAAEIAVNGTRLRSNDDYASGAFPSVPVLYASKPADINVGDLVTFRVVHKHKVGGANSSADINAGSNCTYFDVSPR